MKRVDYPQGTGEVTAIVATYNGADWIQDCLQSLANSHHPVTAIVVDNGSTDNTLALVGSFPDVICLPQATNLGFGRANNIGIREALDRQAQWVFLLNQDARVEPRTVEELVKVSLRNPRFGILSPFHLDGQGANVDDRFAKYLRHVRGELLSDLYLGRLQELYSTSFVNAAAWLLTRKCLDMVGGFDPLFFMYGEDNDYSNRALWHGLGIGIVPSAIVFHDRPGDGRFPGREGIRPKPNVARMVSRMLVEVKQPQGSFARGVGRWAWANLKTGFVLIGTRQWKALRAWLRAVLEVVVLLPRVWEHRRISREVGRHWI